MALVDAYDTRTGEKLPHRVPEHFIGHPQLGVHLSKTARRTSADVDQDPAVGPDDTWTIPQLRAHAEMAGVDLTGITHKADILTALTAPAAGDTEKE